jgi:hypothetical protein
MRWIYAQTHYKHAVKIDFISRQAAGSATSGNRARANSSDRTRSEISAYFLAEAALSHKRYFTDLGSTPPAPQFASLCEPGHTLSV